MAAGLAAILVGISVLSGWLLGLPIFARFYPSFITIKANTGVGFVLLGVAIAVSASSKAFSALQKSVVLICSIAVCLLGLLSFIEFVFNLNFGMDELLFKDIYSTVQTGAPGRMSINTAFCFACLGASIAVSFMRFQARHWISQSLMLAAWFLSLAAVAGHVYGAALVIEIGVSTSIAPPTAVALLLLSSTLLWSYPSQGFMAALSKGGPGGAIFRRQLAPLIFLTLLVGGLTLWGERAGAYSTQFGHLLFGVLLVMIFLATSWKNAVTLNRIEEKRGRSERDLQRLATLLNDSQEVAGTGSWEVDLAKGTVYWTPETYRIYDTSSAEFSPTVETAIRFFSPESAPRLAAALDAAINEGKPYSLELELITAKGRRKQVQATSKVVREDGRTMRLYGVIQDITEKVRTELSLRESEAKFRTFAEAMPQIAFIADPGGNITYYNQRFHDFTGTKTGTGGWLWKGQPFIHPDDLQRTSDMWAEALKTGHPYQVEYRMKRHDGKFRWHLAHAVPLVGEDGRITQWIGTSTDIHEQKELAEKLEEAIRVRDEFLSIASHELKTPITSIKLQFEIANRTLKQIEEQADPSRKVIKTLVSSDQQLNRLARIVEELLDVSRIQAGRLPLVFEPADLAEVVRDTVGRVSIQALKAGSQIELNTENGIIVDCDPFRIEQVILNLVGNAIRYAPGKPIKVDLSRDGEAVVLRVRDFGPGIPKDKQPVIFERFERVSSQNVSGLGLGLFIAREIVRGHGGDISVESETGAGALFTVRLPIRQLSARKPGAEAVSDRMAS